MSLVGKHVRVRDLPEGGWGAGLAGCFGTVVRHEDAGILVEPIGAGGEGPLWWFKPEETAELTEFELLLAQRVEELGRRLEAERAATVAAWSEAEESVARAWREAASPELRRLVYLATVVVEGDEMHRDECPCAVCALRAGLATFHLEPSE